MTSQCAVSDLRMRCRAQELLHRSALVGLDVRERDPPQPLERHDRRDRVADEREQRSHAGVVEQRLLGVEHELVAREPLGGTSSTKVAMR
jgi:hypothetical protein